VVIQKGLERGIMGEYISIFGTIRIISCKRTIIIGRNKIVFAGETKVEEHAKTNHAIPHQSEESAYKRCNLEG
jgi:hypothetical protein